MQYKTPLNMFVPELQEILKEFARKSHAVNLIVQGRSPQVRASGANPGDPIIEDNFKIAMFVDPRFPERLDKSERVGSVEIGYPPGSDKQTYIVRSRLIKNEKYRRGSSDYNSKSSNNVSKVVKTMVENIVPFRYTEIFDFQYSRTRDLVGDWRGELYNTGNAGWNVYSEDLYSELRHLVNIGVQFKTERFQKLAMHIKDYEEHKQRSQQPVAVHHVFVNGSRVAVTAKVMDGFNSYREVRSTVTYDSLESLPENLLANVSLLKILGEGANKIMRGVGFRVSDNEFFVMEPLANNSNA
jgi:hypothetical protein